jgi:hypothetical protein
MDETYELLGVDPASITGLEQYLQVGPRWCGVLMRGPAVGVACFCQLLLACVSGGNIRVILVAFRC